MTTSDREIEYREGEIDGDYERGYSRRREDGPTGMEMETEDEDEDSVLVFEFLKRKKPLPTPRRLDLML